ncbi:MAG: hypothetical protein KC422_23040 [Trueperaceae bacterium]|nr:hypothetical protein [Trueperaceae bacterium]
MALKRVPVNINQALEVGVYELVATTLKGHPEQLTAKEIEQALRLRHGPNISVKDYNTADGTFTLRFEVESGQDSTTIQTVDYTPAIVWAVPLTFAAILSILFLVWKISANTKESVKIVNDTVEDIGPRQVFLLGLLYSLPGIAVLTAFAVGQFRKKK